MSERDGTIFFSLRVFDWTLAFTGCPDVAQGLESILYGWDVRRRSRPRREPDAHVVRTQNGYCWRSTTMPKPEGWDRDPPRSTLAAIWDVHDVLFDWLLKKKPRYLCLHAAAVRFGTGLVCFPSVRKAGKSTLCMQLVSRGHRLFCDDVLPIEPRDNRGVALGIAPLLRKPLPADVGSRLDRFLKDRAGPSDRRWTYVKLNDAEIAPFGRTAPIRAFVLLRREHRARAKLERVCTSEMLRELLMQNFARQVPPVKTLDRLLHLAERAACFRLRYAGVTDASRLLERTFDDTAA